MHMSLYQTNGRLASGVDEWLHVHRFCKDHAANLVQRCAHRRDATSLATLGNGGHGFDQVSADPVIGVGVVVVVVGDEVQNRN